MLRLAKWLGLGFGVIRRVQSKLIDDQIRCFIERWGLRRASFFLVPLSPALLSDVELVLVLKAATAGPETWKCLKVLIQPR